MPLVYDEIRITTRREIAICEASIAKLEKAILAIEKKYRISSAAFQRNFDPKSVQADSELSRWHDNCCALKRWRERLCEHRRIMEM